MTPCSNRCLVPHSQCVELVRMFIGRAVHIPAERDVCDRLAVVFSSVAESAVKASGFDRCQTPHMTEIRELFASRGKTAAALGPATIITHTALCIGVWTEFHGTKWLI